MILIDAGPMVALVNVDDAHHQSCLRASAGLPKPLLTVWPAVTEAMHILQRAPAAQDALAEMFERGAVRLLAMDANDLPRMRELMRKYSDLPMDFADAALVAGAEREGIRTIFTVDKKDFAIYRLHGRERFTILP